MCLCIICALPLHSHWLYLNRLYLNWHWLYLNSQLALVLLNSSVKNDQSECCARKSETNPFFFFLLLLKQLKNYTAQHVIPIMAMNTEEQ